LFASGTRFARTAIDAYVDEDWEGAYHRKVLAKREALLAAFARLDGDEQQSYVEAREPSDLADQYDRARADCPACGYLGLLSGEPEPEWEADWDSEGAEPYLAGAIVSSVRLYATAFDCEVCGLVLTSAELPFANYPTVVLTDADANLAAATEYFTLQLAEDADYDW
jgi:hypothetical protein